MTILSDTLTMTQFDVESMPDYGGIRQRFLDGFEGFVMLKKRQAVEAVLRSELPHAETLVKDPAFVEAIACRVADEALIEKPYVFIALNPEALI